MIKFLKISNYKSIKDLTLDCSRINVLIGEPNVGKSNILEALDLSYLSSMLSEYKLTEQEGGVNIPKYFRVNKAADLFSDGDITKAITINHPGYSFGTKLIFEESSALNKSIGALSFFEIESAGTSTRFNNLFEPISPIQFFSSPIVPFRFIDAPGYYNIANLSRRLQPPFGHNLLEVIKYDQEFTQFVRSLIEPFGLELAVTSENIIQFQKKQKGIVFNMKYEALADTLRRIIFYSAAIRHGDGNVVTLEEPDVNSFPKFVSLLADELINKQDKQFFIATHNPYLLNNLIENTPSADLSVFICRFDKELGTKAQKLLDSDLSELLDYGVDIFFNINRYLDDGVKHSS